MTKTSPISVALQGGGSHGAFTWGVLDYLLGETAVTIGAASGASAGAMNAVMLAHGLQLDGREGARALLRRFWERVALRDPFAAAAEAFGMGTGSFAGNPALAALQGYLSLTKYFSPYQLNPFDVNPLRDIVEECVDFEALRRASPIELFVATTVARTGRARIFRTKELTTEVLLASACLPAVHRSVVIDGEAYWDGGLSANPPLLPLVESVPFDDVFLVLLYGAVPALPTDAAGISDRLAEISFGSALGVELRALRWAERAAREGLGRYGGLGRRMARLRWHCVGAAEHVARFGPLSKANNHPALIRALFDVGRDVAAGWYQAHGQALGSRSSFDLDTLV